MTFCDIVLEIKIGEINLAVEILNLVD